MTNCDMLCFYFGSNLTYFLVFLWLIVADMIQLTWESCAWIGKSWLDGWMENPNYYLAIYLPYTNVGGLNKYG